MNYIEIINFISHILFTFLLAFYLIINLQWYDYKLKRVLFKHHKLHWHIIYFIFPVLIYYLIKDYFYIFLFFAFTPAIIFWYKKLDKKLVFTNRVKRFLSILFIFSISYDFFVFKFGYKTYDVFLPLILTFLISNLIEKFVQYTYKKRALRKLKRIADLKIIAITGSYGKTSIKNFIYELLKIKYKVYKTPRSVNTLNGIIKDICENLPSALDFYIIEAGAREEGDIRKISKLLNHSYAVISKIGPQHIEYFKNLKTIKRTKLELLNSKNLLQVFIHNDIDIESDNFIKYNDGISNIKSSLDGLSFDIKRDNIDLSLSSNKLLGSFQVDNLSCAISVAKYFSLSDEEIIKGISKLKPVKHRLEKIVSNGKLILDDSYNGNIEGMLESFILCSTYEGRKVIVTPGLVEANDDLNKKLLKEINATFDVAIITGRLNASFFDKYLEIARKIILHDKRQLENVLETITKKGDIILFSNDAPNFV